MAGLAAGPPSASLAACHAACAANPACGVVIAPHGAAGNCSAYNLSATLCQVCDSDSDADNDSDST